jgi:hypothetical protein
MEERLTICTFQIRLDFLRRSSKVDYFLMTDHDHCTFLIPASSTVFQKLDFLRGFNWGYETFWVFVTGIWRPPVWCCRTRTWESYDTVFRTSEQYTIRLSQPKL